MSEGAELAAMPMVGIVVVNYFGGDMTIRCLESLDRLTWPSDRLAVALVDNGSEAGFLDVVRQRHPRVRVMEAGSNLGFGGGNNLGFDALGDCDHIALLNNDAIPDAGWLEPLVEVLEREPDVGAVTPKVLLDGSFIPVRVRCPTVKPGGGDHRELGVQLCGARLDGVDVSDRVLLASGFWGWEEDLTTVGGHFAWTDGDATFHLPVPKGRAAEVVELRLAAGTGDTPAEIHVDTRQVVVDVSYRPEWFSVGSSGPPADLVNNVGLVLRSDGATADRGFLAVDDGGQGVEEVFGWSGAAVLLSRRYLDDVGGFDGRLFLYYEDVDLSWRGRLRGWTYRYEPSSVVRHERSATVGSRSALARHVADRNRLLVLLKCAPRDVAASAMRTALAEVTNAARRDVVERLLARRAPVTAHVGARLRVAAGFVRLAPHALRARRSIGANASVERAAVYADGRRLQTPGSERSAEPY